jgi:putative MATE family efflux protein
MQNLYWKTPMHSQNKASLVSGPIALTLVKLGAPMMIGIISMMAFNLVDVYFVGKLGTVELAAMVLTFPVIMGIASFALGLGVGTVAVVSRAIGRKDTNQIQRLTTDSLSLSTIAVAGFVAAGMVFIEPLFRLVGATGQTMPFVMEYMHIWFPGMLFVVVPMVGNNAIRATGDTMTPSIVMVVAVIVNALLDPLLIFGIGPFPAMGLAGAALATVAARGTTFIFAMYVLYFREKMLTSPFASLKTIFTSYRIILAVGLPVAFSNILIPVTLFIVTRIIATYGPGPIAGFGVASRVEAFAMTVIFAFSVGLSPFVGQNLGAGRIDRVDNATRLMVRFALLWGLVTVLVLVPFRGALAALFTGNSEAVDAAGRYLLIIPFTLGLKGVHQFAWSTLNVLDRAKQSLFLEILHGLVLTVPLAFIGGKLYHATGVFCGMGVANVAGGIIGLVMLTRAVRRTGKNIHPTGTAPSTR